MKARVFAGGPPWRTARAEVRPGRRHRINIVFTDGDYPATCITLTRSAAIEMTNAIADVLEGTQPT